MTPPCPGMMWLASLAPKWRLIHGFEKSPPCATTESARARPPIATGSKSRASARAARRDGDGARRPGNGPGPGFLRADRRHQLGAADGAAGKIAEDVGRPDDGEEKHDGRKAECRIGAQDDGRKRPSARHRRSRRQSTADPGPVASIPTTPQPPRGPRKPQRRPHRHRPRPRRKARAPRLRQCAGRDCGRPQPPPDPCRLAPLPGAGITSRSWRPGRRSAVRVDGIRGSPLPAPRDRSPAS